MITGVELKGLKSVSFGNVELFIFGKKHYKKFSKYRTVKDKNDFYDKDLLPFLDKNFLDKICVKTFSYGDREKAKENAERNFKQVINYLRCLVCFKAYEKISNNLAKINFLGDTYDKLENEVSINHTSKNFTLHYGRGRKTIHDFPIDKKTMKDLKKYYFLDDLNSLFSDNPKTEIEEAILTSMHWIGEAQEEYDLESAFIKYWTALETLYSKGRETVRKSITKGVSIILAFGGYGFIKPDAVKKCYKDVNTLYRKRSKIIHRGSFVTVKFNELSSVCKYAIFSYFSFLGLRSIGYQKLEQVKYDTNRLFYIENYKYLTSNNSNIYHKLSCSVIPRTHPNNIVGIVDDKELLKTKKTPCKICFP